MPTLSFHAIELLYVAFKARDAARVDADRPGALTTDSLTAIVIDSAAAEAFINEMVEHVRMSQAAADDHARSAVTPAMANFADALEEVEDNHGSLLLKYQIAALTLRGSTFPRGEAPFQDFAQLVRLRNEVMHLKPTWSNQAHGGAKIAKALEQRGLTVEVDEGVSIPWLNKLEHPKTAEWACSTARAMMLAVLAFTPEVRNLHDDPLWGFKNHLRDPKRFPP